MKRAVIGFIYRKVVKPMLFRKDPEYIHDMFVNLGNKLGKSSILQGLTKISFSYKNTILNQKVDGIEFPNPVGLSAGFDKEAEMIPILPKVGFGFLQIGSITLKPYGGNTGKKAVRLKKSKGLIVNYGLKNKGVEKIAPRIPQQGNCKIPISISIAKTNCKKTAMTENGLKDYIGCLEYVNERNLGDFYTINISCPNTADGEPFSSLENIELLLSEIDKLKLQKPLYLKMPIDKAWEKFDAILQIITCHKVEGVVIGNLLKDRTAPSIIDPIQKEQKGGISGKPTEVTCNNLIYKTYQKYNGKLTIIGVGGIFSAEDAYLKIKLGANLLQLITGMIFQGPQLIGEINKSLVKLARKDGYSNISEAVGALHKRETKIIKLLKEKAGIVA